MCLPPVFDAGDAARPHFALLRELRDALRTRLGLPLSELSMVDGWNLLVGSLVNSFLL